MHQRMRTPVLPESLSVTLLPLPQGATVRRMRTVDGSFILATSIVISRDKDPAAVRVRSMQARAPPASVANSYRMLSWALAHFKSAISIGGHTTGFGYPPATVLGSHQNR